MLEALLSKLAVRQMTALSAIPTLLAKLPILFFSGKLKTFFASFLALFQLLGVVISDSPAPILGDEINLSEYSLIFSDEFQGNSLDTEVWEECPELGTGEIYDKSMLSFDGENLIITTQYLENGPKGAGYYTYGIENTEAYTVFGTDCYYECRMKAPAAKGMWSAFWMMTYGQRLYRKGINTDYTEIDVMESFYYGKDYPNSTLHTLHKWQPETSDFKSEIVGKFRVEQDIYKEYVTYGVLRTDSEYIFYINGKETGRSTNGITSDPAFMLLTCQVRMNGKGQPEVLDNPENTFPAYFVVDYVRVYEKNR